MPHLPDTPATPADNEPAPAAASVITASASPALGPVVEVVPAETWASAAAATSTNAEDAAAASVDAVAIDPAATPSETTAAAETAADTTTDTGIAAPATAAPALPRVPDLSPAACADLLKQHFPALFTGPPKPMKLRIQQDIQQRAPGVFTKGALGAFFRRYTGSTGYLMALGKASQRFDLDGQPAGELSEEHRGLAREELNRRRQLGRERDQAAQAQQQAAQAEVLQARQARLSLLRDFERTTLTLANFCALKGLTPEALTPQLEQARREAAEAPAPRPFDDRRGPPGPRRDDRQGPRPAARRDARPPREGGGAGRGDGRGDARADTRGDGRPDNRPQSPRPAGRPGGRPSGR